MNEETASRESTVAALVPQGLRGGPAAESTGTVCHAGKVNSVCFPCSFFKLAVMHGDLAAGPERRGQSRELFRGLREVRDVSARSLALEPASAASSRSSMGAYDFVAVAAIAGPMQTCFQPSLCLGRATSIIQDVC